MLRGQAGPREGTVARGHGLVLRLRWEQCILKLASEAYGCRSVEHNISATGLATLQEDCSVCQPGRHWNSTSYSHAHLYLS